MRFESLDEWLAWQETLNPKGIELGLDRVRSVLARLDLEAPTYRVITVAGTNGKGSCVAFCEAILRAAGYRTGRYLSPHISRYNERISIDDREVDDASLCAAFEQVDAARQGLPLTYFEFGTLAALLLFQQREVDVAVLEVGLGGRLDAVNAIDPEVGVVVSVGLDHVDWLGSDINQIAREKAGVYRPGRPAIYGTGPVPDGLEKYAAENGISLQVGGEHYGHEVVDSHWRWYSGRAGEGRNIDEIPRPSLPGSHQIDNAATAITAVTSLQADIPDNAVRQGVATARLPGRLERIAESPEILLDVGHNAAAAAIIAKYLRENVADRTVCLLAMLADKDAAEYVRAMHPEVDHWMLAGLEGEAVGNRGRSGKDLQRALLDAGLDCDATVFGTVAEALAAAREQLAPGDRLLIAGSFHTVGDAVASGVYSWQHDHNGQQETPR